MAKICNATKKQKCTDCIYYQFDTEEMQYACFALPDANNNIKYKSIQSTDDYPEIELEYWGKYSCSNMYDKNIDILKKMLKDKRPVILSGGTMCGSGPNNTWLIITIMPKQEKINIEFSGNIESISMMMEKYNQKTLKNTTNEQIIYAKEYAITQLSCDNNIKKAITKTNIQFDGQEDFTVTQTIPINTSLTNIIKILNETEEKLWAASTQFEKSFINKLTNL